MRRLQAEREAHRLSKSKLARLADLNPATITWAEARGFELYPSQLLKVARALGWPEDRAAELLEEVSDDTK